MDPRIGRRDLLCFGEARRKCIEQAYCCHACHCELRRAIEKPTAAGGTGHVAVEEGQDLPEEAVRRELASRAGQSGLQVAIGWCRHVQLLRLARGESWNARR